MTSEASTRTDCDRATFYRHALLTLRECHVPFLIGGAYALEFHTGLTHRTNDMDIMVTRPDCMRVLEVLSAAGYETDLTFPHWLGKVLCGDEFIDVIFNAGNATAPVDDSWFQHAVSGELLGMRLQICSTADLIWCKAYVMERERFDGADIVHLIRRCSESIDWSRLICRFGPNWRVLLSHLILFGFVYPGERSLIPAWVIQELLERALSELEHDPDADHVCQGTLLSREQYLVDIEQWGYEDARLSPRGNMTREEIARWSGAIGSERPAAQR